MFRSSASALTARAEILDAEFNGWAAPEQSLGFAASPSQAMAYTGVAKVLDTDQPLVLPATVEVTPVSLDILDFIGRCGCPSCIDTAEKKMLAVELETREANGEGPLVIPPIGGDDIADDVTTTATIDAEGGQTVTSIVNHLGDQDWFSFEGASGQAYKFTLDADEEGETALDGMITIYDAAGNQVAQMDGGSNGDTETFVWTAPSDGEFFVGVSAYLNASQGSYSLTAEEDNTPPGARSPLDAINWGGDDNRVDTDGVVEDGREVIHVYFAKPGDITPHPLTEVNVNTGWQQFEKDAAFVSFHEYEKVINVKFVEVDSQEEADFIFGISPSAPVLLGAMTPPGEDGAGAAWFNSVGSGWDAAGLQQGGFGFITFTHELGHGMGMAHPHDNGGGSEVMDGVDEDTDSGDYSMNQGVHTVMTYNDGWPDGPHGRSPDNSYGFQGTLMALDIAMLQRKYSATTYNTGDNIYVLPTQNAPGTFYGCLWDTGGVDWIQAGNATSATIDLRAATLQYEVGGGGWVSYQQGIHGGFTIANGVVIENARGGDGADTLIGNEAVNTLVGGRGDDVLRGGAGGDSLQGGSGVDTADYRASEEGVRARLYSGTGQGGDAEGDTYVSIENLIGSSFDDELGGTSAANTLSGGDGDDLMWGRGGADTLDGGNGVDTASYVHSSEGVTVRLKAGGLNERGEAAGDTLISIENVVGSNFSDALVGSDGANRLEGGAAGDFLNGGAGDDFLFGDGGADRLVGGAGDDVLTGGVGADKFDFRGSSGADVITDFSAGAAVGDAIWLDAALFTNFADVLSATTEDGSGNTVIQRGQVQITLTGVLKAQLDANDFLFLSGGSGAPAAADAAEAEAPLVLPDLGWIKPTGDGHEDWLMS